MKKITLLIAVLLSTILSYSQTSLTAGDIAFLGVNTDGVTDADDSFAFVLLKDIDAATTITFTDRGWNDGTGFVTPLAVGDGEFTWTSSSDRTAGEVVTLDFSTLSPSAASFTVLGDQLFAIQGTIAAPVFIAGMQLNNGTGSDDTNWDGAATSNTTSALPDALATGDTAVRLLGAGGVEQDNWQFSCSAAGGCPLSGTPEEIRAILHNPTNWVSNNTTPYAPTVDVSFESPIIEDPVPPCEVSIDVQPADLSVCFTDTPGTSGSMSVVATTPLGTLSYQWEQLTVGASTWSEIGVTNAELEFQAPSLSLNGAQYRVIVTSDNGTPGDDTDDCSVTSDVATLTVNPLPTVTFTAPDDLCVDAGPQTGLGGGTPAQGPSAGDSGVYSGPGVTDDGNGMTYSFDPLVAGLGTHTITYTYTDANGCSGSATDQVEVFALPTIIFTALADLAVDAGVQTNLGGGNPVGGVYSGIGVTDNGDSTYDFDPSVPGVGTHTITYTYTNTNGCTNSASDDVEVIEPTDTTPPTIVCAEDRIWVNFPENCSAPPIPPAFPTVSDNVSLEENIVFEFRRDGVLIDLDNLASEIDDHPVGTTTYTWVAIDEAGNRSETCTSLTIVNDEEAPIALCQDIMVQLDASGNASITAADIDGGSTDNCGIASLSVTPATFTSANLGENIVPLTVTDVNGNTTVCMATVTVSALPELSISNVSQLEGTGGTTTFEFTVSLSEASTRTITVDYITVDGTATAPDDYTAVSTTTLTFNPSETSKTITVAINPDADFEPDETFTVLLSNPTNGILENAQGIGTILNDDVEGCTSPSNVALNKPASQSSTYGNGIASFANDGNLSGSSPWDADLQHTNDDATGPWWEVDLGSDHDIKEVVIHNRTNGFQDRLSDFYVFVSDAPFSASATASDLVDDASVWNNYFEGPAGALETIPSNVNGRYVRIQLSGQGFLHMAELEVMGCPSGPDVCEDAEPVMITAAGPLLDSGSPEQLVASPAGGTWSGQISATGLFDPSIGAGDYIITYSHTNGDGCTQSDTVTIMVDRDNDVPETCDGGDNVALNKPASQSSTYGNGEAFYANDGNLEGGSPWSADLQHTVSGEAQPWWEVDLGSAHDLSEIKIYNRSNRLQSRLNNFYIFVSNTPFSGSLLDQLGDPNIESIYFEGEAGLVETFATIASGQYVRIQLQGSGTLHMAEVEVYGCPTDPSICDGSLPVTIAQAGPFLDTDGEQQLTASPEGGTWSGAVNASGVINPSALGAGNYEATYTFMNENGCTKSDTITIVVNNEGGSACTEAYNLALDGTASHSSTYGNGEAFYANDGNQSGSSPWSADLQHTLDEDSQPWWEVDLGEMATIESVVIYNRTDKLQSRLNNFYVLYSDSPFGTQSLDELLADTNIGREFFSGAAGLEEEFTVDVMARYVRVQKTGSGPLHMAEVEVYGCPFAAPSLQVNLNTLNVWPNPASEDAKASFENPTNVLSLMIYDMQGRIVKVYNPSELNAGMVMDLNVNTLAPGVYVIRTEDERGIHFEKQLVIKR